MVNVSRENRRFGRVIMDKALRVSMRSIGSEASYNMETRNVSDTGFFLRFEKPGRFPFTPSSIMEVWLTLEEGSTIFFNGRMTRVVHPEEAVSLDTEPGIAIRIVQIEQEEENILRDFIRKKALENEAKAQADVPLLSNKDEGLDTPPVPVKEEKVVASKKKTRRKTTKKKTTTKATTSKARRRKKVASVEKVVSIETVVSDNVPPPPEVEAVASKEEKAG